MKIQCLRIREGGSKIHLGQSEYLFKPNAEGHHVCDVTDPAHISALLKVDAYLIYDQGDGSDAPTPKNTAPIRAAKAAPAPDGVHSHSVVTDTGAVMTNDVAGIADVAKADPVAVDEAEDGDDEDGEGEDGDNEGVNPDILAAIEALTFEEAVAEFKKVRGREPHPQAKLETIKARLIQSAQTAAE